MVARPMISASRFVRPLDLSVRMSKSKFGKKSSGTSRNVRVHQGKDDQPTYEANMKHLGTILKTLRLKQIYGNENSSIYDPVIDIVKMYMHELRVQNLTQRLDEYKTCCEEIERYKEIENKNIEKERFYSKFSSWKPSVRHDEFVHDDKLTEAQVRLYELIERCRDFEEREKIFKTKTFGRLASRIDF